MECVDSDLLFAATQGYLPMHEGEIELAAGDVIADVKDLQNGWTLGRNVSRDTVGIFPSDYIHPHIDLTKPPKERPPVPRKPIIKNTNVIENADVIQDSPLPEHADSDIPEGNIIENPHTYERISRQNGPTPRIMDHDDLANGFPDPDLEDFNSNSLPLPVSPKRASRSNRKPHMFVRPNPGKNIFHSDAEPPLKANTMDVRMSPGRRRSTSHTPPPQGRGSTPIRRCSTPQPHYIVNPDVETDGHPPRPSTSCANPLHASDAIIVAADMQSPSDASSPLSPNIEGSEHQNALNETMSTSPRTPGKATKFKDATQRYYQDYRTLECPAITDSPQQAIRYKPILKNKAGSLYGQRGRANEIYYHERHDQQRSMRFIVSLLAALFIGCVFFLWLHYGLEYRFMVAIFICSAIALLLIILFSTSRLCRCIGALILPSFCTTRGRIAFLILITGFLLDGPVTNIYMNMGEVSRSMACSAEQSYNQSMLLLQPFDTMMNQLNSTVTRLQLAAQNVSHGLKPLNTGLAQVEIGWYEGKLGLHGTEEVNIAPTSWSSFILAWPQCIQDSSYTRHTCEGTLLNKNIAINSHRLLTHWGWDRMVNISQTTFSNVFSSMKMFEFRLKFHWSLFPWAQLTIFQHWFR